MKKLSYLLLLLVVGVILTGCGSSNKVMKCTNDINNGNFNYTAKYEVEYDSDNNIVKIKTTETIKSDDQDFLQQTKENTESILELSNNEYGGYSYSVKLSGDTFTSNSTVDYKKSNLKKYAEDNELENFVDSDGNVKLSTIEKIYNALGATCKK